MTPVLALNLHAGFECRHSGACCTAGWPIPVEAGAAAGIGADRGLPAGILRTSGLLPEGTAAVIAPLASGACPFFDAAAGRLCSIQRRLGHDALPASCRHFPRVALREADAVRVTLSHFCPTVARMLFRPDVGPLAVVPEAAGIADRQAYDGFDARETIPPLLRPGVAMDAGTCRRWERYLLDALDSAGLTAEDMLAGAAFTTETLRDWTPDPEPLETRAAHAIAAAAALRAPLGRWRIGLQSAARLFLLAADSVPPGLARPVMPASAEIADRMWVTPTWATFARPLGRYLAARSFGAWSAYTGEGLRTQVSMLAIALAAVRIEAVREAARESRPLDEPLLLAAIRSSDLLLHHLSDATALVRRLAHVEKAAFPAWLTAMGLEAAR
jgi:hypothetical protein